MKKFLFFICFVLFAAGSIYAQCDAPANVEATAIWNKASLTWESSLLSPPDYTLKYTHDGTSTNIGASGTTFTALVRFTSDSLTNLAGLYLTHVNVKIGELAVTNLTIKVWQGGTYIDDTTMNPGTLLDSVVVNINDLVVGVNSIQLTTPILVDPTQELWLGYEIGSTSSSHPAGACGPEIIGFNDLIYIAGTWTVLSQAGVSNYGWDISGVFFQTPSEITGFNVFRDNVQVNANPIRVHSYVDTGLTPLTQYCYTVQSVCGSNVSSANPVCVTTMPEPTCGNIVGTGTASSQYLPFYCYYNYSYTQQIFTASELSTQPGTIVSMGMQYMYSSPMVFHEVVVYLANVNKTTFTSSSDWIPASELEEVYRGPYSCNAADSLSTIVFNTPFEWDGTSNVVVAIAYNEGSYYTSDARFYGHTSTSGNTSLYVYQDGGAYNPANPPSGTLTNYRANTQFCFGPAPTCSKVSNLDVSSITSSSAVVSWSAHSNTDNEWEVVCVPTGTSVNNGTPANVYDTTYTLSNLTDNTGYDVYVRTVCSTTDVSDWRKVSFRTECLTVQTLPYTETFNGYGEGGEDTYPFCWTRYTNYTSSQYPYVNAAGRLYFYSYDSYYSLAVSQPLDLSTYSAGSLALSYDIQVTSSSYGRFIVGIMTDPTNINTLTVLKSYYPGDLQSVGAFQRDFVTLTQSYPNTVYLAFYAPAINTTYSNYVLIDNVTVDYAPTCSAPSNLSVSSVTGTAATITWDAAQYGSTGYTLEYGTAGGAMTPVTTSETSYMLTNLNTGTEYEILLYSNCSSGVSDTLTMSFTTSVFEECVLPDTSANEITGTSTTTSYQVPLNNFWKYTYTQQIFTPAEVGQTPTLITGIAFEYNYSSAMTSKNDVDIYLAHRSSNNFGSSTDWTPISQATLVYHGDLNCRQGWNTFDFDTYFSYNGNDNLVLIIDDNSNGYNGSSYTFNAHTASNNKTLYYYSDSSNPDPTSPPTGTLTTTRSDVKFFKCLQSAPISCPEPMVYVSNADDQSITVNWVSNGTESSWELQYQREGENTWTSAGAVGNPPYVISNVTAGNNYNIRLCAVCSPTDSSDWSYTTAYTPCQSITIPYTENFDNTSYTNYPDCWTNLYSGTTAPSLSALHPYSGTKSLNITCSSSQYAYAVLPRLDDLVDMSNLQILFQAYKTSAEHFVEVGIMSDPFDVSTFVSTGSFSPSVANTWELGESLTNNYTGNGHYIAFRIPQWYSNSIFIDDVVVDEIPLCTHVNNIYAANIEATSAVIHWTAGGSESTWSYIYGPAGTVDVTTGSPMTCGEDSVLLTGLTPNTLYEIYIQSICGPTEESSWMPYSFRSGCAAMTTLPYVENFDSYAGTTSSDQNILPSCWNRINNGSSYTGYPTIYSSSASSTPNCLRFYTYSSSYYDDQYAILPEIDTLLLPINTLQLSMDIASSSSSYAFIVEIGVMSDPANASTFVPVDTLSTSSTSYTNFESYLNNYAGGGQYIALRVARPVNTSYNYGTIDNIVLTVIPDCSPVRNLNVSNVAGSSALVSWEAGHFGTISGYTLEYSEAGQQNWIAASSNITQTSYMLSGLQPQTSYDVRVSANCSSGISTPELKTFTTSCLAGGDVVIGSGNNTYSYLPSYSFYNYSYTQQIFTANELGGPNTLRSISFEAINVNTPNRTLSVYLMHTNVSTSTSWLPASSAQLVFTGPVNIIQGWNTLMFSAPFAYNGTDNLAVIVVDGTGNYSSSNSWAVHTAPSGSAMYTYTDSAPYSITSAPTTSTGGTASYRNNVIFGGDCDSTVTCIAPNISISNVTENSAEVNWVAGYNETAWELEYKVSTDSTWISVPNPTGNSAQLTNLTANTLYNVRMRSDCGGGDYSIYKVAEFRTQCGVVTIPFTENFDSYGTGSSVYPSCWSKLNTYSSDRPYVTSGGYSTPGCLYFYTSTSGTYNMAITPEFDHAINLNTLMVSFMYSGDYDSDKLIVGVISDPTDYSTFVPVDTVSVDPNDPEDWNEYEVYLNNYQGNGHYIAFMNAYLTYYAYAYLDNIVVDVAPTCMKPRNLSITTDNSSATLTWTETGTASAWDIEYGTQGFTQGTGTVVTATTNPYTISGLTMGTTYDFYVRANCGNGDESVWLGPVAATPGSYNMPTSGSQTISMCGGVIYDDGGIANNYSNYCDAILIVNPDTAGMLVQLTGTFDVEEGYDILTIYDGAGTSGTVLFDSEVDYTLNVTSTTGPLTIAFESDVSENYSGFEIQVNCVGNTTPETCDAPTGLTATNLTKNSVVLDWAQTGTPDSWTINYKKSTASTWTTVNTSTHPYTITNLDSETSYEAFVTATCGDLTSGESNHITFTTLVDGIEDIDMNTVIYPNPTTGKVTVSNIQSPINGIEVYDVYGKLLNRVEPNLNEVNLDITDFASGVYFLRIETEKGVANKRIVKK